MPRAEPRPDRGRRGRQLGARPVPGAASERLAGEAQRARRARRQRAAGRDARAPAARARRAQRRRATR
ncbi:MAG: hypothetical protein MZW92_24700 [Comamonadaceae bacterium]|nr:hypothetical protein [Comamonadaceae bacterium]